MNPVDNRPQNELAEMVFVSEVVLQSKIAELAAKRLSAIKDNFDQIEVWSSIQSILVAAGNVSKILCPQEKKYAVRGKRLRELLKVEDNNILSDRSLRNHFEHYDDRIEDWFKNQSSAVYSDLAVDPFKSIWGNVPSNHHRAYDPLTQTLTFRGESFELAAVLKELKEIRSKCRDFVLS
ncbi:MAG: hypothetical protein KKF54_00560 [Candidatus Omnitrophica bacterium]|nr:hypothetical protein [Candidatus Omnitrophota bacterium]